MARGHQGLARDDRVSRARIERVPWYIYRSLSLSDEAAALGIKFNGFSLSVGLQTLGAH
jgi:hypothetical protein